MSKFALILAGVAALAGVWLWSQKSQVKETVTEKKPAVSGEYVRVKTELEKDEEGGGMLRFFIEPAGASSFSLSAFSMEVFMDDGQGSKPVLNPELVEAGWSFPIAMVEGQTLKLSGVFISPTVYMLSEKVEIAAVPIANLKSGEIEVRLGEENTKFLKKDASGIGFRYE